MRRGSGRRLRPATSFQLPANLFNRHELQKNWHYCHATSRGALLSAFSRFRRRLSRLSRPVKRIVPAGYAAKGVLYGVVGLMALDASLNPGEGLEGAEEALVAIRSQPAGLLLAGLLMAGLAVYVVWQLSRALLDPEGRGEGMKGIGFRVVSLAVGLIYGALVLESVDLLDDAFAGEEEDDDEDADEEGMADFQRSGSSASWMASLLQNPVGRFVVLGLGLGVIGFGLSQLHRLVRSRNLAEARHPWLARAGYASRGVLSGLIGWFIFRGALTYSPGEFRDLDGVLGAVRDQPFGNALLFALGAGLVSYGVLQLFRARAWYRFGSG